MSDRNGNLILKSRTEQTVEAHTGRTVPHLLQEMYVQRRMPQAAIAAELGVSRSTVIRWMERYGFVGRHPRQFTEKAA